MKDFKPKKIIVKYLSNEATALEEAELLNWVQSKKNQKVFKEFLKAQHLIDIVYHNADHEAAFDDFLNQIQKAKKQRNNISKRFVPYLKYAAVLVGVTVALLYFLKKEDPSYSYEKLNDEVSLQIINGNNEYFNISTDKAVKTQKGVDVAVVENGVLKYASNPQNNNELQNILKVPYGKTFKVILSDGSAVELNAGSTLKYPSVFKENEPRTVFLEGEAFFNVTKTSSNSFIVNSKSVSVKVTGTAFNMSSYSDDNVTEVVLTEGSVGVKYNSTLNNQENYRMITPSQMASISQTSGELEITNVDIEKHIAWKNGSLFFENDPFESIKKILERHYNVKIVNHFTELNKFRYNGNFQNDSIEKVLNTIKTHTNFSFNRKGDTISINNPKKSR